MDRERLKEVQQTDLTDSKVNQEFVDWLRNKGPTWLLGILVVLVAWLGYDRYQQWRQGRQSAAFFDLEYATKVESLENVAIDHAGVASVPELARLRAADTHLTAAVNARDPDDGAITLDAEGVRKHLDKAEALFRQVLESVENDPRRLLFRLQALSGLATVAESAGRFDQARQRYDEIIRLAEPVYPLMASQIKARRDSLDGLKNVADLPERSSVPRPSPIDPLLRDLLDRGGSDPS
ncbi:MAG: hypothetical protein HRU76_03200 [Phycisphaeraceae bacterium]|nr:hypothetical protein [Phycisphaerales bacterium]QOJ16658.1 MAG: hypothetical protein HRU76_03200 [Phycisphaeraceae bacterium]